VSVPDTAASGGGGAQPSSPSGAGAAEAEATGAQRRGLAETVLTGWQGVLTDRLSLAPRRKSLLGE
jgi:hypothetical protein